MSTVAGTKPCPDCESHPGGCSECREEAERDAKHAREEATRPCPSCRAEGAVRTGVSTLRRICPTCNGTKRIPVDVLTTDDPAGADGTPIDRADALLTAEERVIVAGIRAETDATPAPSATEQRTGSESRIAYITDQWGGVIGSIHVEIRIGDRHGDVLHIDVSETNAVRVIAPREIALVGQACNCFDMQVEPLAIARLCGTAMKSEVKR